jgi:hypothetical protein
MQSYTTFREFYPFYLGEHSNANCRRLHFLGTSLVIAGLAGILWLRQWAWLLAIPVAGYGPAWAGHFFFERNRPATFRYPLYSLAGDFVMYWQILTSRVSLRDLRREQTR